MVEGLLTRAYIELALGQDDRYEGYRLLAAKAYEHYRNKISGPGGNPDRVKLPSYDILNQTALDDLLNPQSNLLPYAARAVIRTYLKLPPETNARPAISTNPPPAATTNAVKTVSTNYVPANPGSPTLP